MPNENGSDMHTENDVKDGQESSQEQAKATGEDVKTFTQEQVDEIVKQRLARAKHEKPADYDDLKAKADKYDEMEGATSDKLNELNEKIKALEETNAEMKHAADVSEWKRKASEEYGIAANILRGDSLEEIEEHAKAIKEAMPVYPSVDPGKPATGQVTRESILAIEDPKERKAAMLAHVDLL